MNVLSVRSTGSFTPLGSRAWQCAASLRRRASAYTRWPLPGHADMRITLARVVGLDERCTGTERLLRLAAPALHEAVTTVPGTWPPARPLPLFVALPDVGAAHGLPNWCDAERFALEIPRALDIAPEYLPVHTFPGGAVAGADALAAAYRYLHQRPEAQQVLVGGVDSLSDPALVPALHARHWLRASGHAEGFIASEGAAFVLLSRKPAGGYHLAVWPPGFGHEAAPRLGSEAVLSGAGLITAARAALAAAQLPAGALHSFWSDADGTPWRGSELASLGVALSGLPAASPAAEHLGELGAAWLPVLLSQVHEMRQLPLHPVLRGMQLQGHTALLAATGLLDHRACAAAAAWLHTPALSPTRPT